MINLTLGVAIGVVFVFLLFSLFLSTALEAVAAVLKLRGRALRVAIAGLIGDPAHLPQRGGFGLIDALLPRGEPAAIPNEDAAGVKVDKVDPNNPESYEAPTETAAGDFAPFRGVSFLEVFGHPLVAGSAGGGKPSYVPSRNFASALLFVLQGEGGGSPFDSAARGVAALPPGALRTALQTAVQEAHGDWDKLRSGVELWFDHAMDRLSGEYKRFSQLMMFLAGLGLAAAYDVNALAIAQRLYVDDDLRAAIEQQATEYVKAADPSSKKPTASSQQPKEKVASAPSAAHGASVPPLTDKSPNVPAKAMTASASPPSSGASGVPSSAPTGRASLPMNEASGSTSAATSDPALIEFRNKLIAAKTARTDLTELTAMVGTRGQTPFWTYLNANPSAVLGWVITALAGMLGAPFWFQILQKLVNLRGTGPKPSPLTSGTGRTP